MKLSNNIHTVDGTQLLTISKHFKDFSNLLDSVSDNYWLIRGKLSNVEEGAWNLDFHYSTVEGTLKFANLTLDYREGDGVIYYDSGFKPFSREKEILKEFLNLINGVLEEYEVDLNNVYWDVLDVRSKYKNGYIMSTPHECSLLLNTDTVGCILKENCPKKSSSDELFISDWEISSLVEIFENKMVSAVF